jgi:alkylhydroperoxidase family enzyme
MRLKEPRVPPAEIADLDGEAKEMIERYRRDGAVPNIFATLVHHPKLMKRWTVFANHILSKSTLPPRDREIAILRVGWLCRAVYEFSAHVRIGKQVGMTDEEVERVTKGADAPGWTPFEAALIRAVDELKADAIIGDATWAALAERYDTPQLMDLVFTIGQYNLVSMALNTLGVQPESRYEGFPSS